jgi:hypothetical protein
MKPSVRREGSKSLRAAAALALAIILSVPAGPAEAESANAPSPQTIPLDMVIAVDESGSLTAADVTREIAASATIAQSVLNPHSRVTVLGFGSDNGKPGQHAVDEICRPTTVDGSVSMGYLATCVKGLHRRTEAEGSDTDHVAVIAQSLSTLRASPLTGALKVIFLLTDGKLDVARSPAYGSGDNNDPHIGARRNAAAEEQLKTQINQAQQTGVQIWPLGFGAQVTSANLDRFATGASRQGCDDRSVSQPKARIVHDSTDVFQSLFEAYKAMSCSEGAQTKPRPLPPGEQRELKLDIPAIATDGTITVNKGDPRVTAEFFDPRNHKVPTGGGKVAASFFTRSGGNTGIEALRIVNPISGTWRVRLTAPKKLAEQVVSATAIWQGAVQATIVPEPPVARPGQQVTVRLSLVTRTGAVTDEKALRGLAFSVATTGAGSPGRQSIAVRDDGEAPDDTAHDGRFAGTFTAPDQPGDVSLVGVVSGPALRAERVPVTVHVTPQGPVVQGTVTFDSGTTVHPGAVVRGALAARNNANAPQRVRLVLDGAAAAASLAPSMAFDLAPGESTKDFTVTFSAAAAEGGRSMTVKLVDAAAPSTVHANGLLTVTVEPPPTLWERIRGYVATGVLLLILVALIAWQRRRAWKKKVGVKGLRVALSFDGERVGQELSAPNRWSREFRFVIRQTGGDAPRLQPPRKNGDEPVYVAKRKGDTGITLRSPGGESADYSFGEDGEALPSGHKIVFRDNRKKRRSAPQSYGRSDRRTPRGRRADRSRRSRQADGSTRPGRATDGFGTADPAATGLDDRQGTKTPTAARDDDPWF